MISWGVPGSRAGCGLAVRYSGACHCGADAGPMGPFGTGLSQQGMRRDRSTTSWSDCVLSFTTRRVIGLQQEAHLHLSAGFQLEVGFDTRTRCCSPPGRPDFRAGIRARGRPAPRLAERAVAERPIEAPVDPRNRFIRGPTATGRLFRANGRRPTTLCAPAPLHGPRIRTPDDRDAPSGAPRPTPGLQVASLDLHVVPPTVPDDEWLLYDIWSRPPSVPAGWSAYLRPCGKTGRDGDAGGAHSRPAMKRTAAHAWSSVSPSVSAASS